MSDSPPPYSPEIIEALLVDIVPALLLSWLETQPHAHHIFRGFQITSKSLRLTPVQMRFKDVLQNHPDAAQSLIDCWKLGNDELLEKVHGLSDKKLHAQLAELQEIHGERTMHLALMLDGRKKVLLEPAAKPPPKSSKKKATKFGAKESKTNQITELTALLQEKQDLLDYAGEQYYLLKRERDTARQKLEENKKSAREKLHQADLRERELARDLKRETARAAKAEELLQEKSRVADRNERRARKLAQEQEQSEQEIKRLRRQVRQQQQISEDLRKQLAATSRESKDDKKVLSSPTKAPSTQKKAPPRSVQSVDPADQSFLFEIAGRKFSISARQFAAAVDRNNEELVYSLTQALFELRESNAVGHKMFIDRVRAFDRYSARVLTGDSMRVLVDASNVARFEKNQYGKGILDNLLALRDELRSRSYFPIIMIADASLPHFIDQPHELKRMVQQGMLQITNKGEEADEYLTRLAQQTGAFVVTNDVNFHHKIAPHFEPLRIGFNVDHGAVYLHEF